MVALCRFADEHGPIVVGFCGRNSAVECQLPKLKVVGSNPIARCGVTILIMNICAVPVVFFCFRLLGNALSIVGSLRFVNSAARSASLIAPVTSRLLWSGCVTRIDAMPFKAPA